MPAHMHTYIHQYQVKAYFPHEYMYVHTYIYIYIHIHQENTCIFFMKTLRFPDVCSCEVKKYFPVYISIHTRAYIEIHSVSLSPTHVSLYNNKFSWLA